MTLALKPSDLLSGKAAATLTPLQVAIANAGRLAQRPASDPVNVPAVCPMCRHPLSGPKPGVAHVDDLCRGDTPEGRA